MYTSKEFMIDELIRLLRASVSQDVYYSHSQEEKLKKRLLINLSKPTHIEKKTNRHPNISKVCTVILLISVAICGVFAYNFSAEILVPTTFDLPNVQLPYNLTMIEKDVKTGEVINSIEFKKYVEFDVRLITTGLVVNNPIMVEAYLIFDDVPESAWKTFPDVMILVFPNSFNNDQSEDAEASGGAIKMKKMEHEHVYGGFDTLRYPLEGTYGYLLLETVPATHVEVSDVRNGIQEMHVLAGNLMDKVQKETAFQIKSDNPTNTNKLTISLTLVIIGIGILQLRESFVTGVTWLFYRDSD